MSDTPANHTIARLHRAAGLLRVLAPALAVLGLAYRATLYWSLPAGSDGSPGLGPMLDFGLALVVFAVSLLCAGVGVLINLRGTLADRGRAYLTFFVGVGSFLVYELVTPYVPALM